MANFYDLNPTQTKSSDGEYIDLVFTGFEPNTIYGLVFAWEYEDAELGVSEYSNIFEFITPSVPAIEAPSFSCSDVTYFQGILNIKWNGKTASGQDYGSNLDLVYVDLKDNEHPTPSLRVYQPVGTLSKAGTFSIAVPPRSHSVRLFTTGKNGEVSYLTSECTVTPKITPPSPATSVLGFWEGTSFVVTFNHDPSAAGNEYLKEYLITLTGAYSTKTFTLSPVNGTTQRFAIDQNTFGPIFGNLESYFSGNVRTIDIYNNPGTPMTILSSTGSTTISYVSSLAVPTITAITEDVNGYKVLFSEYGADKPFKKIEVYHVTSNSAVDPVSGYEYAASGTSNPIPVRSTTGKKWVKIRAIDTLGVATNFSTASTVTPIDIVAAAVDAIAPDPIQSATASASVDPADISGQTGLITLSLTNAVATVPSDFNGYIVKIIRSSDSKQWTQEFSSKTYLTSLPVNLGISVGQTYTLSVATTDGRNQSSFVNVTGNPISVTDTRTNTSVSTNLLLSATDSILTARWTAPADSRVGSYRVQLTSTFSGLTPDFTTPLQEVYANSTVVSFGGLSASTKYGVRVTTKYSGSSGPLSSNHLVNSATLNSSGAISDGIRPSSNPTVTVKSLFKAFALSWSEISNTDDVTYEVYVKTVDSTNIVDPANLVMEINGTFAVINSLKDGTAIAYPSETSPTSATDYYFAVRAKDADGISTAAVTSVGPFTASRTGQFDIATNAIYANHITSGQINADKMVTDLLFASKTINVGESTSTNRIRLDGNTVTMTDSALPSPSTYSAKSRIFIGAGNYFSSGTNFYADNTGRLSIGDKLKFDTSGNLTINGAGTFTGLLTTGSTGSQIKIGTGANGANNGIWIDQGSQYIYTNGTFSLGGGSLTGTNSTVNVSGTVTVKGNSELQGDLRVVSPGVFYIGASKSTGQRLVIDSAGIAAYNAGGTKLFGLDTSGLIDAKSGLIADWSISTSSITKTSTYLLNGNNVNSTISLDSSTREIKISGSGTGNTFEVGMGLPTATEAKVFWAGTSKSSPSFYVNRDGTVAITGTVTIGDTTAANVAAKDLNNVTSTTVNTKVTQITGGKISTGSITSGGYVAPTTGTTPFSGGGTLINLDDGSIISKQFVIKSDGAAEFKGALASGISITAPIITGTGQLRIGTASGTPSTYPFEVDATGKLTAKNADIKGVIRATTGWIGGDGTGWSIDTNTIGNGTISLNAQTSTISGGTLSGTTISGGSLSISKTSSPLGTPITNTVSISDGIISFTSTGSSFLNSGAVSISGKDVLGNSVSGSYGANGLSFTDAVANMNMVADGSGNLQLNVGSGRQIRLTAPSTGSISLEAKVSAISGFSGAVYTNNGSTLSSATFRNIAAGTGPKSSTATDGLLGDIWIQYAS